MQARKLRADDERDLAFRRAEDRRAALQIDVGLKGAIDHRRARLNHLRQDDAGQRLGVELGQRAAHRRRRHGPRQDEGRDDQCLARLGIDLERRQHAVVQPARAGDVDQREQRRLAADGVGAVENLRHAHAVGGVGPAGDRPHEGLVAVLDVAVDHVQVARVRGQVRRLDNGAARVVDVRAEIGELDEVLEVAQRGLAPAARQVIDIGRAVDRRKGDVLAADDHAARRITRQLRKLGRRHAHILGDELAVEKDRRPLDDGAMRGKHSQRLIVVEVDADLLEDAHGGVVDLVQRLFADQLVDGQVVDGLRHGLRGGSGLAFAALFTPAGDDTLVGHRCFSTTGRPRIVGHGREQSGGNRSTARANPQPSPPGRNLHDRGADEQSRGRERETLIERG